VTPATSKWSRPAREARARLTDQERRFRDLRETPFADAVMDLARILGWRSLHIRPARTAHGWVTPVAGDGKGYPDLTLVRARDRRLIFAELKREVFDPEPDQIAWLEALSAVAGVGDDDSVMARIEVHVWRPSDLSDPIETSRIYEVLR
jgi:hypothetical protein